MSNQVNLCRILPQLYHDLLDNTLPNFVVKMHGISVPEITSELTQNIINRMYSSAAAALKQQCGREYEFSDGEKLRATDLSVLFVSDLEGLTTNNSATERDLSQFDREAKVARSPNRWFKAKNIRNNMVLYKTKQQIKVDKVTKKLINFRAIRSKIEQCAERKS